MNATEIKYCLDQIKVDDADGVVYYRDEFGNKFVVDFMEIENGDLIFSTSMESHQKIDDYADSL